jgi:hypothetical protein
MKINEKHGAHPLNYKLATFFQSVIISICFFRPSSMITEPFIISLQEGIESKVLFSQNGTIAKLAK